MKTNKYVIGTAAVALLLTGGAMTVSAYQGDYTEKGSNCTTDRHAEMTEAFENLDYQTWADLMTDKGRVTEVVTNDNFAKFVEAHELAQDGNYDAANEIRTELGLRTSNGERMGAGHKGGSGEGRGDKAGAGVGQGQGQGRGNR